jgi:hypothetical protein
MTLEQRRGASQSYSLERRRRWVLERQGVDVGVESWVVVVSVVVVERLVLVWLDTHNGTILHNILNPETCIWVKQAQKSLVLDTATIIGLLIRHDDQDHNTLESAFPAPQM